MKSIKTILGALAVASLLSVSFSANAQENGNRDENGNVVRGSYESNKFWEPEPTEYSIVPAISSSYMQQGRGLHQRAKLHQYGLV